MFNLNGKYGQATVYTDNIDDKTISDIINYLNYDISKDQNIKIMPDCHAGSGCVIGFTSTMTDKVIPNVVGVDIGCGVLVVSLGNLTFDLEKLDKIIHQYIPSGSSNHGKSIVNYTEYTKLKCYDKLKNKEIIPYSIGSVGGGNHYIELGQDSKNNIYLMIHSGSRNLGKQVAEHYQELAINNLNGKEKLRELKEAAIVDLKAKNKYQLIEEELKNIEENFKKTNPNYPEELSYLTGKDLEDYLHDMKICQEYATLNRRTIADIILKHYTDKNINDFESFETIHNYINFKDKIIRKGAISAYKGEKVIIPINMRDGSIIAIGKGNLEWNYSAPHGAGRIMSRGQAKENVLLEEFIDTMKGVYTTCVNESTLDESPFAYKSMNEIIDNTKETVDILDIITPLYNFKA